MKFTTKQIEYAKEYKMSILSLSGPVESFNVRPPELLIFNNIKIFFKVLKKQVELVTLRKKLYNTIENTVFIDRLMIINLIIDTSLLQGYEFLLASNNS